MKGGSLVVTVWDEFYHSSIQLSLYGISGTRPNVLGNNKFLISVCEYHFANIFHVEVTQR